MKITNIILLAIAGVIFSCHEVLDKTPLDEITEITFWNSPTDMELYINGFYPILKGSINYHTNDNDSDNMQPITPNNILNGTRSIPATGGGWEWSDIRKINYFLENAKNI